MERILIAEDEQDIQELLKNYLEEAGYETASVLDGVEAVTQFSKGDFDLVLLDETMIRTVVQNLLVNAARYSPEKARISVGAHEEEEWAIVQVENSGVTIPKEAKDKIYDAFYRVEGSRNRKSGGSGLGLYIVREILERHHGTYCMENTASGVQFTFRLPKENSKENTQS